MKNKIAYRLGLDIRPRKIAWASGALSDMREPNEVVATGVREFSVKNRNRETTPAAVRRAARSGRRQYKRFRTRRDALTKALARNGLLPEEAPGRDRLLEGRDPYKARTKGAREKLDLHGTGVALLHINKRRGFQNNSKTDATDKDRKAIGNGTENLRKIMRKGLFPTLGMFLASLGRGEAKRFRPRRVACPSGKKGELKWEFFSDCDMYKEEFDKLWNTQRHHYPETLTDEARDTIQKNVFHQRPLIPPKVGRCKYETKEERTPKVMPMAQEFRILEILARLKVHPVDGGPGRFLKPGERRKKTITFDRIRKLHNFARGNWFNDIDDPDGDKTERLLVDKRRFGREWWNFPGERQNEIVDARLRTGSDDNLIGKATSEWGLDENADKAVRDTPLPWRQVKFGGTVPKRSLPGQREGSNLRDAIEAAGYRNPGHREHDLLDSLPCYTEALDMDPIGNPLVHIGLNQLRLLVNAIVNTYGPPAEIIIELAH